MTTDLDRERAYFSAS